MYDMEDTYKEMQMIKKHFVLFETNLGILVDFMAEIFKQKGHKLIGIRGMPRVGKTESVVASSVCANKRGYLFHPLY